MVFGVSVMSRRHIWPAKLCAIAQVLNMAFFVVSRIAIMFTIEELLVLQVLSTALPTDFVLEAVASVAQSCPQYH